MFVQAYTPAEIYGWFTEGFGAKDEARARLEELTQRDNRYSGA
jgi:hypothetical protein